MRNTFDRQQSPNVIGYIPGSGNTDESVIYLGHWDHLGYGAPINGDSIINGATDNAVAIAWMLEMARCFNALKEKPRRNIVFLSPTCEETGFLGTKYYVEHPLFPIDKIAAVINLDVFPLWGENNDVTITGYGNSELDDTLAELAKNTTVTSCPTPTLITGCSIAPTISLSYKKASRPCSPKVGTTTANRVRSGPKSISHAIGRKLTTNRPTRPIPTRMITVVCYKKYNYSSTSVINWRKIPDTRNGSRSPNSQTS